MRTIGDAVDNKTKACCVTGHRRIPDDRIIDIKTQLEKEISQALNDGFKVFISGFADGTDLLFAEIVAEYKKQYPHLYLEAAIPHLSHIKKGDTHCQSLLSKCDGVNILSQQYHQGCYMKRNRYMVQNSDRVIAVYDGRDSGGTLFTMRYAHCLEKEVRLIQL